MSEADIIARTKVPATRESLQHDLPKLGVRAGDTLLVHCSMRAMGWVCGGQVAVLQALFDAVGDDGTLVMPSHSTGLTEPANWSAPPVPLEWIETIRSTMPAYEAATTPTRNMGAVAEAFRTWPGVRRSAHPASSMAAWGRHAQEIVARHELSDPLGPTSPLGELHRLDAKVLLIGVEFNRCTALHLAEHIRWPDRSTTKEGAPIIVAGEREWVTFDVPQIMDDDEFLMVGEAALASGVAARGSIAQARCVITRMQQLVGFAVQHWSGRDHPASASHRHRQT
ncbi:aminoglycoside N(3)-acetyltransferase [Devosia albogilva]|uniref:Aminoglycoside N(3)-acetyltransferase n=1 Tax=Devosia albogilva TaxID=429726 RepID=A0ABW5QLQ5_9HYPH